MTMLERKTGRTTRMLQDAIQHARDGEYVVVLAADTAHRNNLADTALRLVNNEATIFGFGDFGIGQGKIVFETPRGFDWTRMRPLAAHPSVRTYVDHHAIEAHWGAMIREYHRWDEPA